MVSTLRLSQRHNRELCSQLPCGGRGQAWTEEEGEYFSWITVEQADLRLFVSGALTLSFPPLGLQCPSQQSPSVAPSCVATLLTHTGGRAAQSGFLPAPALLPQADPPTASPAALLVCVPRVSPEGPPPWYGGENCPSLQHTQSSLLASPCFLLFLPLSRLWLEGCTACHLQRNPLSSLSYQTSISILHIIEVGDKLQLKNQPQPPSLQVLHR